MKRSVLILNFHPVSFAKYTDEQSIVRKMRNLTSMCVIIEILDGRCLSTLDAGRCVDSTDTVGTRDAGRGEDGVGMGCVCTGSD